MSLEELVSLNPDITVKHSGEFSFSREAPTGFFNSEKSETVKRVFSSLYSYLDMPYVFDLFSNHEHRRTFRNTLNNDVLEVYGNNALRTGQVNVTVLGLAILSKIYLDESDSEFFSKVKDISTYARENFFDKTYDSLAPDLKFDKAFRLKEKIASFLNYLEVKKDTS